jgi:hypothetical protein
VIGGSGGGGGGTRGGRVPQRPQDLFTEFPATTHDRLIVRYPDAMTNLEHSFSDAAERLADSYKGRAPDDALLLPFLYLYRHAFELNLKGCIELAAACRVLEGDDEDGSLEPAEVQRRLHHVHGHKIMALFEELDGHLKALGFDPIPKESRKLHTLLSNTDPRGESFRYDRSMPGRLGDSGDDVDFIALRTALRDGFGLAQGALSMLDDAFQNLCDAREEHRAVEAELRAEFEAEMRAEFEDYY